MRWSIVCSFHAISLRLVLASIKICIHALLLYTLVLSRDASLHALMDPSDGKQHNREWSSRDHAPSRSILLQRSGEFSGILQNCLLQRIVVVPCCWHPRDGHRRDDSSVCSQLPNNPLHRRTKLEFFYEHLSCPNRRDLDEVPLSAIQPSSQWQSRALESEVNFPYHWESWTVPPSQRVSLLWQCE